MESLGSANLSDKQSGKSEDLALVVILVTDIQVLAITGYSQFGTDS